MFNTHIRLIKFGSGFWFRIPGVVPGFIPSPERCQTCDQLLRVVVCLNSSLEKIQLACSEVSFLLLEINLLLKFDFLLKYEAYPIK